MFFRMEAKFAHKNIKYLWEPIFKTKMYLRDFVSNPLLLASSQLSSPQTLMDDNPFVYNLKNGPLPAETIHKQALMDTNPNTGNLFGQTGSSGYGKWGFGFGRGNGDDDDGSDPDAEIIDPSLTLESIGGLEEHINFLKRAVFYPIKHRNALKEWGVEPPKGIMFHGPPGTGKTMLAKAMVNELSKLGGVKVSFFYQKGGECFNKYLGESESKLRKLFTAAIRSKPSVIFFDEIDGLCPSREVSEEVAQAYASVVTSLLGLIDSVKRGDVFIIGATNRLDAVDAAIKRPGRFDKNLLFPLPDETARIKIIKINTANWPQDRPTDPMLSQLGLKTSGFTGADLAKLCTDTKVAALFRCAGCQTRVTQEDWNHALSKMQRSATNVYGSTLYVAVPPSPSLAPLLATDILNIIGKLKLVLPDGEIANLSPAKLLGTNAFLVWSDNVEISQNEHLSYIMNGVLADPALAKFATYKLDGDTVARKMHENNSNSISKAIQDIISQVSQASSPSILFIPRINTLYEELQVAGRTNDRSEKLEGLFLDKLREIRGLNQLIIASWTGPRDNPSNKELKHFFGPSFLFKISLPNVSMREKFFGQLFSKNSERIPTAEWTKEFVAKIAQTTDCDPVHFLTAIYDQLTIILGSETLNAHQVKSEMKVILDRYNEQKN